MSAQENTSVTGKADVTGGSEAPVAHAGRTTRSRAAAASTKTMPSSVSMPVDLHSQSGTQAGTGNQGQQGPALNPLYQLTVSKSQDTVQGLAKQREGSPSVQEEMSQEKLQSNEGDSQESINQNRLQERKLEKQKSHTQPAAEDVPIVRCPQVNCPEKIIICLDVSEELEKITMRSRAGDKYSALQMLKRALGFFIQTKHRQDKRHEFALVTFQDVPFWECNFTSNPREIMHYVDDLIETKPVEEMDAEALFQLVQDKVTLPNVKEPTVVPPPYTVRMILFYGRSQCVPDMGKGEALKLLQSSPHFFIDAYYVHETPSDENKCEEIFEKICDLDNGLSYVFEVSRRVTKIYDCMAQLLPHPLQRPLQAEAEYSIGTDDAELGT